MSARLRYCSTSEGIRGITDYAFSIPYETALLITGSLLWADASLALTNRADDILVVYRLTSDQLITN